MLLVRFKKQRHRCKLMCQVGSNFDLPQINVPHPLLLAPVAAAAAAEVAVPAVVPVVPAVEPVTPNVRQKLLHNN